MAARRVPFADYSVNDQTNINDDDDDNRDKKADPPPLHTTSHRKVRWLNPMARMGETLIEQWPRSPGMVWLVLQVGGLIGWYVLIRLVIVGLEMVAPLIEGIVGIPMAGIRGCLWLTMFGGSAISSHLLWAEMDKERCNRLLEAFARDGKSHTDMFMRDRHARAVRSWYVVDQAVSNHPTRASSRRYLAALEFLSENDWNPDDDETWLLIPFLADSDQEPLTNADLFDQSELDMARTMRRAFYIARAATETETQPEIETETETETETSSDL